MLYKLMIRETELHPSLTHYSFVREPITIVVRHKRFQRKGEEWKNDIVDWAWQTLGHRTWDWNILETVIPFRDQSYYARRYREELFFLFEEKSLAVVTKLAHAGKLVELPHKDIDDYLRNGEEREIQAD